jgi:hypothetical protein
MPMGINVRFSIKTELGTLSFHHLSDIDQEIARQKIAEQIIHWSRSIRELGMRHLVAERLSAEAATRAAITFDDCISS